MIVDDWMEIARSETMYGDVRKNMGGTPSEWMSDFMENPI